jgi:hypothetical protein
MKSPCCLALLPAIWQLALPYCWQLTKKPRQIKENSIAGNKAIRVASNLSE